MALTHTILALLAKHPGSGYDITKHFEEGMSCYWKATQQQVYRELGKLSKKGYVRFETQPQVGKPDKKLYEITDSGWQELARWYLEPTEPTAVREDLLVKVLIGYKMPQDQLIQEIQHRRALHRSQLTSYQKMEADYRSGDWKREPDKDAAELKFMYLTLKRGIAYEESWLTWCDEVMATIKEDAS